ncbi:hypothetical protein MmTuc01_2801 [Methanosarcina mazei Tuc01]|uniref:Uncharacterized protein n=1 Tax=Methanosarcina mazei Tuc01 TaxID=1236903 RepID=M1Q6Y3_METMZ|nr:hypothetical protein MmTuc01_2801 [Methanosarcina mazei Tuc01]
MLINRTIILLAAAIFLIFDVYDLASAKIIRMLIFSKLNPKIVNLRLLKS